MKTTNHQIGYHQAKIIKGGKDYFETLIHCIEKAEKSIHLQTYIFNEDSTGKKVADALLKAARKNVSVYIVTDGFASQGLSKQFIDSMTQANIRFRFFEPWLRNKHYYLGRRLHHKIFTADNKIAIVGGINIADRYNDTPESSAWLDFAIRVRGDIANRISKYCETFWQRERKYKLDITSKKKVPNFPMPAVTNESIRLRINDWLWHTNEISASYIEMFRLSKNEIMILCSYFIPGKVMRRLMKHAIKRGVSIKIIVAGKSDILLSKLAERWLYDWLLRNNIELYEYKKGILHGKMAVADRKWMTIGSYNLNNLSTYASLECNLDIYCSNIANEAATIIENIALYECENITKEKHSKQKNIIKQFSRWASFHILYVLQKIITISMTQKHQ